MHGRSDFDVDLYDWTIEPFIALFSADFQTHSLRIILLRRVIIFVRVFAFNPVLQIRVQCFPVLHFHSTQHIHIQHQIVEDLHYSIQ